MAMRKVYDACVSTGERDGKKFWSRVGSVFRSDDGRMALKLDVLPMPKTGRDGYPEIWVSFFEPRDGQQAQPQQGEPYRQVVPQQQYQQQHSEQKGNGYAPQRPTADDDQIPF